MFWNNKKRFYIPFYFFIGIAFCLPSCQKSNTETQKQNSISTIKKATEEKIKYFIVGSKYEIYIEELDCSDPFST